MVDKINFSTFQLIINNEQVKKSDFDIFTNASTTVYQYEDIHSKVSAELNDNYFWVYFQYGSPEPRAKNVLDINTKKLQNNPRKETQAELNEQLFFLYDFKDNVFFLNNSKKTGFICRFLEERLQKTIDVKTIYVSIDEFSQKIKSIEKIYFTGYRDLFSSNSDIFKGVKDVFAYGEPESFKIEAKYSQTVDSKIKDMLKKFDNAQKDFLIGSLVCIGKDENGFASIFNSESFSKKIDLHLDKNSEKLFNENEVKTALIEKIGIENV